MQYPKQVDNVYVEELDDEVCVYDWDRVKIHALNPTAALVWEQCDGKTAPAQMAMRLETELNVTNADKLVALSLNRLENARLLQGEISQTRRTTITRREVLKMAGIGIALLPVVTSMALPSIAEAQSGLPAACLDDLGATNIIDFDTRCTNIGGVALPGPTPDTLEECCDALTSTYGANLLAVYFDPTSQSRCLPCVVSNP